MRAAWAAGVSWAECDVHESATGPLFVLHDETLDRTTDLTGPIADRIDAELDGCRLRDAAGRVTSCRLPRLADVLRAMPAGGRLLVEVKAVRDHAELAREVAGRDVWVQSFDAEDLRQVAAHEGRIRLALLVGNAAELAAAFDTDFRAVHLNHRLLDPAVHRRLSAAGRAIGVWTVNAEADLRRVVDLGVAAVITDEPARAARVVYDLCGPG